MISFFKVTAFVSTGIATFLVSTAILSSLNKNKEKIPTWPKPVCYQYYNETFQVDIKGEFGLVLSCVKCVSGTPKLHYVLFDHIEEYYSKVDCAYAKLDR